MDNAGTRSHGPNAAQLIALHTLQPTARSHEVARMAMLDCLACIVAGSATAPARMALDLALAQGARGVAAVLGTRERLAPAPAAFANGVAGHALDFDDMTAIMIGHPSVVLVPAILALAQSRGLGAGAVLDAYVAGFEYATWFGRRMIPAHYDAGWHSTSSIGVFGATAASARPGRRVDTQRTRNRRIRRLRTAREFRIDDEVAARRAGGGDGCSRSAAFGRRIHGQQRVVR